MTEYKRLTRRNEDGTTWVKCPACEIYDICDFTHECCCEELQDRLAELEDKIENGTLVELPDMRVIPDNVRGKLIQIVWFDACGEIQWQYFNIKRKAEAEAKLEELKRGLQ